MVCYHAWDLVWSCGWLELCLPAQAHHVERENTRLVARLLRLRSPAVYQHLSPRDSMARVCLPFSCCGRAGVCGATVYVKPLERRYAHHLHILQLRVAGVIAGERSAIDEDLERAAVRSTRQDCTKSRTRLGDAGVFDGGP